MNEIFILRLLKKLADMGHRTKNEKFFLSRVSSLPQESIEKYLNGKISIKEIKERTLDSKAKAAGILHGKPFETLCSNDVDWLRFTTKELDIYRWKGKVCNYCKEPLSTDHILNCMGLRSDREVIKLKTGIEAKIVLNDPSVLNKRAKSDAKSLKAFVAGRISKMIHSAGRSVIG